VLWKRQQTEPPQPLRAGLAGSPAPRRGRAAAWLLAEVAAVFALFFLYGFSPPPDVNEAHYLAKAKDFWQPEWIAPRDLFLDSADAHLVFYWTFGWVTQYATLPHTAWIGRVLTWLLLAVSWQRLSFAVVPRRMMSLLTAGLLVALIHWGHLAGEWLIGGVEAKGFAFVLVFLGLEALVRGRWHAAFLLCGAATAFHVLVGGWSIIAAGFAWLLSGEDRPSLVRLMPAVLGAVILSLAGVIPALRLTLGLDPETVTRANEIYVFFRLPHHLVPHTFPWYRVLMHVLLVAGTGFLFWKVRNDERAARLRRFVVGSLVIAVMGGMIDIATYISGDRELAARLLRYYWFRLSDVMVPLGAALAWGLLIARYWPRMKDVAGTLIAAAVVLILVTIGTTWQRMEVAPYARADLQVDVAPYYEAAAGEYGQIDQWHEITKSIRQRTPADAVFMTPPLQYTFKWNAHRAEVVNFKDIPQNAAGIVKWRRRFLDLYTYAGEELPVIVSLVHLSDAEIRRLARKYNATHMVIDLWRSPVHWGWSPDPFDFELLLYNERYAVYRVDPHKGPQDTSTFHRRRRIVIPENAWSQ